MKIAVVTGASSGMGREFVRQISALYPGLDEIWVFARRQERMERLRDRCHTPLRIFAGNLLKKKICKEYGKELEDSRPDVRILVNAAGFGRSGSFREIAEADKMIQTDMVSLNCTALTRMTELTIPFMGKGGRIINLASAAGFCPQCGFAVYAATKAYVLSLSRALHAELHPRGITVTAVCPGPVDTEFFRTSGELKAPLKKRVMAKAPDVVRNALKDSRRKKDVSVYGIPMKTIRLGARLIPHRFILLAERICCHKCK